MRTEDRLQEILDLFSSACKRASDPDFKSIWREKALQIQRADLAAIKVQQQEGNTSWQ